jgi:hypothetical protein
MSNETPAQFAARIRSRGFDPTGLPVVDENHIILPIGASGAGLVLVETTGEPIGPEADGRPGVTGAIVELVTGARARMLREAAEGRWVAPRAKPAPAPREWDYEEARRRGFDCPAPKHGVGPGWDWS